MFALEIWNMLSVKSLKPPGFKTPNLHGVGRVAQSV